MKYRPSRMKGAASAASPQSQKYNGQTQVDTVDSKQPKLKRKGSALALAIFAFRKPIENRTKFHIPKDSAAWLDHLIQLVRRSGTFHFVTDKDIENIISRWRTTTVAAKQPPPTYDPDLPLCYDWSPEQVGEWVELIGYPQYKEVFASNFISGRKLIHCNASALNKMGIQYFKDIKNLAVKIRELLGTCRPNILRAIAHIVPYEEYLKFRSRNGPRINASTFRMWCRQNGFPYHALRGNKCALVGLLCEVLVEKIGDTFDEESVAGSDISLREAPTVEFTVRHMLIRNRLVQDIIDALIRSTFEKLQDPLAETIRGLLKWGMDQLFSEEELMERIKFAKSVAQALMEEVKLTAEVMQDIHALQQSMNLSTKDATELKIVAQEFVEDVTSIAAMLACGEFDIENLFREEPELQGFVGDVVAEAEVRAEEVLKESKEMIQDVVVQATKYLLSLEELPGPNFSPEELEAAKRFARRMLDEIQFEGAEGGGGEQEENQNEDRKVRIEHAH